MQRCRPRSAEGRLPAPHVLPPQPGARGRSTAGALLSSLPALCFVRKGQIVLITRSSQGPPDTAPRNDPDSPGLSEQLSAAGVTVRTHAGSATCQDAPAATAAQIQLWGRGTACGKPEMRARPSEGTQARGVACYASPHTLFPSHAETFPTSELEAATPVSDELRFMFPRCSPCTFSPAASEGGGRGAVLLGARWCLEGAYFHATAHPSPAKSDFFSFYCCCLVPERLNHSAALRKRRRSAASSCTRG